MKALKKLLDSRTKKIVAIAVLVVLFTWLVLFFVARDVAIGLIKPLLWAFLVVAVVWLGIHFGVKAWRKRKRTEFDERVAAKEGIEDRRREWATWTQELEKQGIDRYELPFYLLVGEPQSGKSVLLHNSDLHFPFGQSRLSGVGGTRGCDWWFTEEAVVLDLAGRLFTHDGGAGDRIEFEAFLEMLYEFRPLCPANGVILVVPCDSLLRDGEDACAAKATKIQNALLTLTTKLQAQLPVYLVLTKGDQVFGFAESVHRLDVEHRHQMFGWSRPAEKLDAPFDMAEVTDGFTELVQRSRLLRAHMVAGARVPEALPEIDRLYAFPHELEGLQQNLEVYLKRIFTASNLTDRVFFRGLYLTSGLQSGVPIAKVCTQLFGQSGEADMRNLEALFSKQRAYFIKDLIRTRVFGERGLVRPTQGRVQQARRMSVVGYGLSGAVALASLIFAFVYLLKGVDQQKKTVYGAAVEAGGGALETSGPAFPELLYRLQQIVDAVEREPETYEKAFTDARDEFRELYCAVFDARMLPLVQRAALDRVEARLTAPGGLGSHEELRRTCDALVVLLGDLDCSSRVTREALLGVLDKHRSGRTTIEGQADLTLEEAFDWRLQYGDDDGLLVPQVAGRPLLVRLARLGVQEVERCLEPGSATQPRKELGYMLAWLGAEGTRSELAGGRILQSGRALELCARFSRSMRVLKEIEDTELESGTGGKTIAVRDVFLQARPLGKEYRERLVAFVDENEGTSLDKDNWPRMNELLPFVGKKFEGHEGALNLSSFGLHYGSEDWGQTLFQMNETVIGGMTGEIVIGEDYQPDQELDDPLGLLALCDKALPADVRDGRLAGLADRIREVDTTILGQITSGHLAAVFLAECSELARIFQRDLDTPESAVRALLGDETAGDGSRFSVEVVNELVSLHQALKPIIENRAQGTVKEEILGWQAHVENLLYRHLQAHGASVADWLPPLPLEGDFAPETWKVLEALGRASGLALAAPERSPLGATAGDVQRTAFFAQAQALQERWLARPSDDLTETGRIVKELNDLAQRTQTRLANAASLGVGYELQGWSGRLDALLAERLGGLEREVKRIWLPNLPARESLRQVAAQALTELDTIDEKIRASERAGMGGLAPVLAGLEKGGHVMSWLDMPRSRSVLEELQQWRIPTSVQQVKSDPEWRVLRETVQRFVSVDAGGEEYGSFLAQEYADAFHGSGTNEQPAHHAGIRLVREIRDQFARVLRNAIRERYLEELAELLDQTKYRDLFEVLFWDPRLEVPRFRDSDVQDALASLLNRKRGDFVKLKQRFRLDGEKGIGRDVFAVGTKDEEGWAPIHRFLDGLQPFLLGDQESIAATAVSFWLIPESRQSGSLWNLDSITRDQWRDNFYYPADDSSDGLQKKIMDGNMGKLKVSNWRFSGGSSDRKLLLIWSELPLQSDARVDPDRFHYAVPSCLAPMLLAWCGRPDDDEEPLVYSLSITPVGTASAAPMRIEFERPLPQRPPKP